MRFFCLAFLPITAAFFMAPDLSPTPGGADEYFDILGEGKEQWRLVFRGTAGIQQSVFEAYTTGIFIHSNMVDENCKTTNWTAPCSSHYRNHDALDNWSDRIQEVLFAIIDKGEVSHTLRFSGVSTSYMDWFSKESLLDSTWSDLEDASESFFSIAGDDQLQRRFFINDKEGECEEDKGWFVAIDSADPTCEWEKGQDFPSFRYSSGNKKVNHNKNRFKKADAIAIFVKYMRGRPGEYMDIQGTGENEWRVAFRGSAGTWASLYDVYTTGRATFFDASASDFCHAMNFSTPCDHHYRSDDAIDNWGDVESVYFGIVSDGEIVKGVTFNGKGSTSTDWLSPDRVVESDWMDMVSATPQHFSILGHEATQRRFFLNEEGDDCEPNVGWFVAVENSDSSCSWEAAADSYPYLLFSTSDHAEDFGDAEKVQSADEFVVLLKYE